MNPWNNPPPTVPERVWLHRSQWRMVATLVLLLAAVVVSLALASGFWWTLRAREAAKIARPVSPPLRPVATRTIPASALSVIEVYPAATVRTTGPRVTIRSPGGKVTGVPVRAGQRVQAGQALVALEQTAPVPVKPQAAASAVPPRDVAPARQHEEVGRLQRRLDRVLAEIQRARAEAQAKGRPESDLRPVQAAAREADARVQRAREVLAGASYRRQQAEQQYQAHQVSRFKLHFARSAELLAQVELRHAEEEADTDRQSLAAASAAVDQNAAARATVRITQLAAEAASIQARLAQFHQQVAGARQHLDPPVVRHQTVVARASRDGVVAAVSASPGKNIPQGAPLLVIAAPGRTRLRAQVPPRALTAFPPGAPVTIRRRDGQRFTGHVARVRRTRSGAALVEIIPPPSARLEGGMALVPPRPSPAPPRLPIAALARGSGGLAVWVAIPVVGSASGWIAHQKTVRTAGASGSRVAIVAGLNPGDRVIVAGARGLREGQPVAPVEVDPAQAS